MLTTPSHAYQHYSSLPLAVAWIPCLKAGIFFTLVHFVSLTVISSLLRVAWFWHSVVSGHHVAVTVFFCGSPSGVRHTETSEQYWCSLCFKAPRPQDTLCLVWQMNSICTFPRFHCTVLCLHHPVLTSVERSCLVYLCNFLHIGLHVVLCLSVICHM